MSNKRWRTKIAYYTDTGAVIGGCEIQDIMEKLDFAGSLFLLYQQRMPTPAESKLLSAAMISVLDHGIVAPSVVSRIVAASGSPLQACVAAGILTIGDVHGGAGQELSRKLGIWVKEMQADGLTAKQKATEIVGEARKKKALLEGFGHPLHPTADVRVDKLMEMSRRLGLFGPHLELVSEIEAAILAATGKKIPANIDGAISGVLMDLGFDWRLARVFVFVPRAAGIAAHAVEETVRERGWRVVATPDEVLYDGPAVGDVALS
jgi:citrate synthase